MIGDYIAGALILWAVVLLIIASGFVGFFVGRASMRELKGDKK